MRKILLALLTVGGAATLAGCRCSDGERPKLFPNLFHRDDVDDRGSRSKAKAPCDNPTSRDRPCTNFMDGPIAPVSYGRPIYTTMPNGTGDQFPGGTYGPTYPTQPGRTDELPPGTRIPPTFVPLPGEAMPKAADPNANTKLVQPDGRPSGDKK